jgi:hypothetical protein
MCAAPRFVPTLTEVVRPSRAESEGRAVVLLPSQPSQPPPPVLAPAVVAPSQRDAPGTGLQHVGAPPPAGVGQPSGRDPDELAAWIEAEVGDSLRRNLHDLIATALVEQIDVVAARLREDIEPMVRRAVLEAVANEAASRTSD